jgi:ABC-type Fe3+-hydroxamate transport system substrate-binding protein
LTLSRTGAVVCLTSNATTLTYTPVTVIKGLTYNSWATDVPFLKLGGSVQTQSTQLTPMYTKIFAMSPDLWLLAMGKKPIQSYNQMAPASSVPEIIQEGRILLSSLTSV